jgi:hypothetical protein
MRPARLAPISAPSGTAAVMKPPTTGLIKKSLSSNGRATAMMPSSYPNRNPAMAAMQARK